MSTSTIFVKNKSLSMPTEAADEIMRLRKLLDTRNKQIRSYKMSVKELNMKVAECHGVKHAFKDYHMLVRQLIDKGYDTISRIIIESYAKNIDEGNIP